MNVGSDGYNVIGIEKLSVFTGGTLRRFTNGYNGLPTCVLLSSASGIRTRSRRATGRMHKVGEYTRTGRRSRGRGIPSQRCAGEDMPRKPLDGRTDRPTLIRCGRQWPTAIPSAWLQKGVWGIAPRS